jgi:hypothetical protein
MVVSLKSGGSAGDTRGGKRRSGCQNFGKMASPSMIWSRRRDDDWRRGRFRRRGPRRDVFTILRAKKEEDFVKENVDNAAKVLDSIIKETVEQIFVDEVSEEVFEEVDELSNDDESESASKSFEREKRRRKEMEKEQMRVRILKSVVKSKFNELDGTFLSVLGAYIKQAEMKDDMPLLSLLQAIKEETLQAVTVEMQPEMQVVQLVARLMRAEDRAEVLKIAHKGGGRAKCLKVYDGVVEDPTAEEEEGKDKEDETSREDYVPKADIDEVERAAAQLCDEMELREVVPSWDLLYQIILARESARQMSPKSDKLGVYSEIVVSGAFAPSELPKAEAALIRKLVQTDDANKRREMLFEAMESARIENEKASEEARKQHEEGKIKLTKTTRGFNEREEEITDEELMLKDLRPGRMIDCLINLRCSLLDDERVKERGEQAVVAERMAVMYFEVCDLVLKNANGGILPTNRSSSKNNSSASGGGAAGAR